MDFPMDWSPRMRREAEAMVAASGSALHPVDRRGRPLMIER